MAGKAGYVTLHVSDVCRVVVDVRLAHSVAALGLHDCLPGLATGRDREGRGRGRGRAREGEEEGKGKRGRRRRR